MSHWKFIREGTEYFYNIGIEADGSLYNPNGYPAEQVRALVLAAEERKRAKKSAAIKRAWQRGKGCAPRGLMRLR